MNTRIGEGFQQEIVKMYEKTNGKNAEDQVCIVLHLQHMINLFVQISRQDEKEEAMARIQMAVDEWLKNQKDSNIDPSERSRSILRDFVGCASSSGDGGSSSFDGANS